MTFTAKGTPDERFWSRVEKRGPNECWPWLGAKGGKGYGRMKIDGFAHMAHRLAYFFSRHRAPSAEMVIRHRCDNPNCCNPKHLVKGTQRQNVADMVRRGRGTLPFLSKTVPNQK